VPPVTFGVFIDLYFIFNEELTCQRLSNVDFSGFTETVLALLSVLAVASAFENLTSIAEAVSTVREKKGHCFISE
jgi:hypothetical protein